MVLYVVTPDKEVVNVEIESVLLPGQLGQMEILPEHTHLISLLEPGVILYKDSYSKKEKAVSIGGGLVEVKENFVRVLVTVAESSEEIDVERAERALKKAEEELSKESVIADQQQFVKYEAALKRALARLEAAKYK